MKTTASAIILAALSASALAAEVVSKPFKLVLINENESLNGTALTACHEGAAIEGLCANQKTSNIAYKEYTFKHDSSEEETANYGRPGTLRYKFSYTGADNETDYEQEPLGLFTDPSTNVALALFGTGTTQEFAFDSEGRLNIQSYLNDTVTPPTETTNTAYYRWYVCETDFEGYVYSTLNWVYGKYGPENPSCVKYTVKRVYV